MSVVLVNEEVGNHRLQLERRRCRDRAPAHMHLHFDVVHACIVTDFLILRDTSHQAEIGLNHIQGLLLEVLPVSPTGVQPFNGPHRRRA